MLRSCLILPFVSMLVLLAAAAGLAQAPPGDSDPGPRGGVWELRELDLELVIEPAEGAMTASGRARLRLTGRPADELRLELPSGKMAFEELEPPAGAEVVLGRPADTATVRLAQPHKPGEELEVRFRYRNLESRFRHPESRRHRSFAVDPRGAFGLSHYPWYPTPAGGDADAAGTTGLTVPAAWRTVSNGRRLETAESRDTRTETWRTPRQDERGFVAGPLRAERFRAGERELGIFFFPEHAASARAHAGAVRRILEALKPRFGPLPVASYAIAEVDDGLMRRAESEHGYFVGATSTFRFDRGTEVNLPLLAHELGHAWWGTHVRVRDPGAQMINEGLAQYAAVLAIEALEGEAAATRFLRFSRRGYHPLHCARGYFLLAETRPDRPLSEAKHTVANAKGQWVYHMLRRRLGDERFFAVLRQILATHAGERISFDEVRAAFLRAAPPEAKLERFFADWLERTGAPVVTATWADASDRRGSRAEVKVRQRPPPYELLLEVAVDGGGGSRRHEVELSGLEKTFVFESPGRPTGVRIDPDHRLLVWTPEYGPRPGTAAAHLHRVAAVVRLAAGERPGLLAAILVGLAVWWVLRRRRRTHRRPA